MIYKKITGYCEKHNMSICAFERKCDIANGIVARWKDDKSLPSLSTLQKIEKATGIPMKKWIT